VPLPVPRLITSGRAEVDGNSIFIGTTGDLGGSLPEEFILREALELDPDDLDSAASLCYEFGDLFQIELQDLPSFQVDDPTPRNVMLARREEMARLGCLPGELYHKDEVRLHFEALRFLGETWLAMQTPDGLDNLVGPALTEELIAEIKANLDLEEIDYETVLQMEGMARIDRFEDLLDAGLSIFHVGISSPEERSGTIYSIACLQLYNLTVEQAPIRYCANENCRRLFVHQRGTAQYGQYREAGVKYCSAACGKAQNERDRRRRRNRATRR
jgi:hypothetical protein